MTTSDAISCDGPAPAAPARQTMSEARAQEAPLIALFVLAALFLLLLIRNGTAAVIADVFDLTPVWHLILLAVAGALCWIRYDAAAPFIRRFGRASALFLAFFFATEPFALPAAAVSPDHPAVLLQGYGRWIGLALAFAAWFRPAGLFAGAMTLWVLRDLNTGITGFNFSNLDIRNVVEVLALIGIGALLVGAARQQPRIAALFPLSDHVAQRILLLILAFGIGGHLGNYFYSAIAKLALDGGPGSWLFDNRLYHGIPGAMEKGTYPFAAWPAVAQFVYDAVRTLNLPLHLFSFAAQFAAIIAIWRRKWVMMLTVVYDAFHLAVYATLGLLFWKWIALNAIILATLATVPDAAWTRSVRIALGAAVVAGAIFFKTATLAWYDTPAFLSPFIEAELADGTRMRAPSAYFDSGSYQVSHGKMYAPPLGEGHFNFSIWGSVLNHADRDAGRACAPPARVAPTEEMFGPPSLIAAYVWAHHDGAIRRGGADGRHDYRRYPHHHFPSPFAPDPFLAVDKRDIRAYFLVLESVCLGIENGRLTRDIKARTEIPLPRPDGTGR